MHHRRLHRVPDVCRPRSADGSTPLGLEESLPDAHRTPKIRRSCSNSGNVHPDAAEGQRGRLNAPLQKSSHECETHTDRNHSSQRPIVRFRGARPNSSRRHTPPKLASPLTSEGRQPVKPSTVVRASKTRLCGALILISPLFHSLLISCSVTAGFALGVPGLPGQNSRNGILCTPSVNPPRKQRMSLRPRTVSYGKSFLRAFTREKRYLTCVNFPFLSSPPEGREPPALQEHSDPLANGGD